MAKNKLKRLGRFELLELMYDMRRENEELTRRCQEAEQRVQETEESLRAEYEEKLRQLRTDAGAGDLQQRMARIEEQLLSIHQGAEEKKQAEEK